MLYSRSFELLQHVLHSIHYILSYSTTCLYSALFCLLHRFLSLWIYPPLSYHCYIRYSSLLSLPTHLPPFHFLLPISMPFRTHQFYIFISTSIPTPLILPPFFCHPLHCFRFISFYYFNSLGYNASSINFGGFQLALICLKLHLLYKDWNILTILISLSSSLFVVTI